MRLRSNKGGTWNSTDGIYNTRSARTELHIPVIWTAVFVHGLFDVNKAYDDPLG